MTDVHASIDSRKGETSPLSIIYDASRPYPHLVLSYSLVPSSLVGAERRAAGDDCMRTHEPLPVKHGKPGFTAKRPFEGIKINV
jgi:hypothetical protein